jgi:hypothetical protein
MSSLTTFPATATPAQPGSSRTIRRTVAILVLFVASFALGVAIHIGASPASPADRYPTMDRGAPEPAVTAAITAAISAKDPKALASAYSAELLQGFQDAMAPVVNVDEISYAGGVQRDGETLASYVATGEDAQGRSVLSGFVVHVENGQITGFN